MRVWDDGGYRLVRGLRLLMINPSGPETDLGDPPEGKHRNGLGGGEGNSSLGVEPAQEPAKENASTTLRPQATLAVSLQAPGLNLAIAAASRAEDETGYATERVGADDRAPTGYRINI